MLENLKDYLYLLPEAGLADLNSSDNISDCAVFNHWISVENLMYLELYISCLVFPQI